MKKILSTTVIALGIGAVPAQAAVSEAEFEALKAQLSALANRVAVLEQENASLRRVGEEASGTLDAAQAELAEIRRHSLTSKWVESIKIKGDFRYRYEYIDAEGRDTRERNRIRARTALIAQLPADVEVAIGVATGGDDPVSSNQTLGAGNTSKDLKLDLGYFTWRATDTLSVTAGKYNNPLYRPQKTALLWDGDWRPEGINAQWKSDALFVNFLGDWLESDTDRGNDEFAWGLQGGIDVDFGDASLTTTLGYYDFPTAGNEPYFDDDFFGNTSIDGVYAFNYEMIELGADLGFMFLNLPTNVFGNYVQNQDADEHDTGWLLGARLGKVSGRGTWQLAYQYPDLEADAVLGLLSDSDFAGGGTDGKGHRISGAYGISPSWNVGFTWFLNNEAGMTRLAEEGGAIDYDRVMLDTEFKF